MPVARSAALEVPAPATKARAAIRLAAGIFVPWLVTACPAKADTPQSYPLVFSSPAQLRNHGIAAQYGEPTEHFPHRCYYFGDGSTLVSVSPQFLSRNQARGFTLHSLCLALQSPIRYDPETGRRLPTYVLVDGPAMVERFNAGEPAVDTGSISEELPLEIPDCFSRGTPYSDCRFSFDPRTGVPVEEAQANQIAVLGKMYDEAMQTAIREGSYCQLDRPCRARETFGEGEEEELISGFLAPEGYEACTFFATHPRSASSKAILRYFDGTFYDVSPSLPKGFGYALMADGDASGFAGPEVEWEGVKWFIDHYWSASSSTEASRKVQEDTFLLAQGAGRFSVTESALSMLGERLARGNSPFSEKVRRWQDLELKLQAATWCSNDASPETEAAQEEQGKILEELNEAPGGWAFRDSLDVAQVQAMLTDREALVLHVSARDSVFIWAVTKTDLRWVKSDVSSETLIERVATLRCGLDESAWKGDGLSRCIALLGLEARTRAPRPLPFDFSAAHALYKDLFGSVEDLIGDKHLLIVPSGPLTQLPFQVLVTQAPASPRDYAGAAWLAKRHALTVLPSVASLSALRKNAKPSAAPEPFIGYGDPVLTGQRGCGQVIVPDRCPDEEVRAAEMPDPPERSAPALAAISAFFRDGQANVAEVRKLCPLPDTAHELRCVARSLDAPPASIVLAENMTEAAVKKAPLDRYRVVHFATHGLLAGETAALARNRAEPALVFTPPETATEEDDGLLTASEVADLKLDSDWVVMSACNTAGAGAPGAEALSGLARAFFYAGARALLVSHWPVNSYAATMLTSHTFAELGKDPSLGRAEAFRRAMLALMNDRKRPWVAHPSVWAPFVVVGEGGVQVSH